MNSIDCAWLAAAIDGEGNISIGKYGSVRVGVYNTHRGFCEKAATLMNGKVFSDSRHIGKRKICYRAEVTDSKKILSFLPSIIPHLIIKPELARRMVEIATTRRPYRPGPCIICGKPHLSKGLCSRHYNQKFGREIYRRYRLKKLGPPDYEFWKKRTRNAAGQFV